MERDSKLRIDKELGVIEKIVPKVMPDEPDRDWHDVSALAKSDISRYTTAKSDVSQYTAELTGENDIEDDYKYQRDNFYNLVEKGSAAIDGILELAKESEHPRTYEVAGQLIKNVAEVTEKLGDLQEKMRRLKEVPNNAPRNVTNALFVGSTKELQKMLKDNIGDGNN